MRDKVYGCEHLVRLEIHLLHASHLQVSVDVLDEFIFLDVHDVCQQQQIKLRFFCQTAFACFLELHDVFQQVCGEYE